LLQEARQTHAQEFLHAREMQDGMHFAGAPHGFRRLLIGDGLHIAIHLLQQRSSERGMSSRRISSSATREGVITSR